MLSRRALISGAAALAASEAIGQGLPGLMPGPGLLASLRLVFSQYLTTNPSGAAFAGGPATIVASGVTTALTSTTIPAFTRANLFVGWGSTHRYFVLTPAQLAPGGAIYASLSNNESGITPNAQIAVNGTTYVYVSNVGTAVDNSGQSSDAARIPGLADATYAWSFIEFWK